MCYLNLENLEALSVDSFQNQQPYPWASIPATLTPGGFQRLRATLPDVAIFHRVEGVKRSYGQAPHDRYILHYRPGMELPDAWKEFIAELHESVYQSFLRRMLGPQHFILTLEWYYAWQGCSVSPHCDARRKRATHIFYFNTEEDWDASWGGQILILDDAGRFQPHSAPNFEDLNVASALIPRGNESLLFQRTEHSWHGVQPLQCPPNHLRKLFIVTINVPSFQVWWRRIRGKDPDGYPLTGSSTISVLMQIRRGLANWARVWVQQRRYLKLS